jgi:hypothetical protein
LRLVVVTQPSSASSRSVELASASSSLEDVAVRARAIYEREIGPELEKEHRGKYLVIDVRSGEYEIDADGVAASDRAAAKHPDGEFFFMRVGSQTLGRIGFRATKPA